MSVRRTVSSRLMHDQSSAYAMKACTPTLLASSILRVFPVQRKVPPADVHVWLAGEMRALMMLSSCSVRRVSPRGALADVFY